MSDTWTCRLCDDGKQLGPEEMIAHFRRFHPSQLEESKSKVVWPDGEPVVHEEFDYIDDIEW